MTTRPALSDAHANPNAFAIISRRELHELRNRCHAAEGLLTLAKIENAELTAQRDEAVAELGRLRVSLSPTQDDPKRLGLVEGGTRDDGLRECIRAAVLDALAAPHPIARTITMEIAEAVAAGIEAYDHRVSAGIHEQWPMGQASEDHA